MAFVFSSSWTLPLYASLRGSGPPITTKRRRRRSFRILIAVSVAIAIALVLPLCVFASSSNEPVSIPTSLSSKVHQLEMQNTSKKGVIALVSISSAANLILTIPAILITIPLASLPWAAHRTSLTISKLLIYAVTVALSVLPRKAMVVLGDLLLVLSLLSTYVLPGESSRRVSPAYTLVNRSSSLSFPAYNCTLLQTAFGDRATYLRNAHQRW